MSAWLEPVAIGCASAGMSIASMQPVAPLGMPVKVRAEILVFVVAVRARENCCPVLGVLGLALSRTSMAVGAMVVQARGMRLAGVGEVDATEARRVRAVIGLRNFILRMG